MSNVPGNSAENAESNDQHTQNSISKETVDASEQNLDNLVTARFRYVVTAEGHAIITGRDGELLQYCEDEPIHIPGAIQSFGLLISLAETENGQFSVRVASENSKRIIGYTPHELFKLSSFTDILCEEQCENLLDHVYFIRDEMTDPADAGPEVFIISIKSPNSEVIQKLWCAMHSNPSHPELIICEFELDDDPLYPLEPLTSETSESPEDTLNGNPTQEDYDESTQAISKPLRVLRTARKRKGEAGAIEISNIMSQVQEQLASAPDQETFLKILVGVVKDLTGFHRVMIYQFDTKFNGRVISELVDPQVTRDLYRGLRFPASDIPRQARDLYKIEKVRLLYDRDNVTARLVCRSMEDLEQPLDLSYSYLRAMSPIHIKYLQNMAVRSSMSISINAFNELWGLIACHGYGARGMRVSFPIRNMCRLVGDTASRNIERLSYASRLQARRLIKATPTEANPSGYIIASSEDLLKIFDADFGLLSIRGEAKIMGKVKQSNEALALLQYLRVRSINSVFSSQDIREDFPDLGYAPGLDLISGLLLLPLTISGKDFIVFFRKDQVSEMKWAGNPYEKFIHEGTEGYLEPRKSFKSWSETVVGKCREWTEEQMDTAGVLCQVYGKFIEVWRQKEAALQSSELTRLLLANSAHEVRTPLNAIINYLEIALEGALDQETRENLSKSHSASKSLIYVINDLLDLTKTEEGQLLIKNDIFDLPETIFEATNLFQGDAKRKGLDYNTVIHPQVPRNVFGDQRLVRQAVVNMTANALQFTTKGWVRIEVRPEKIFAETATIEVVVQDSGCGMSKPVVNDLFRDLGQVQEAHSSEDSFTTSLDNQPKKWKKTLGLGLAVVARTVQNMDGQLRLKTGEGKGSRFVAQLTFRLPKSSISTTDFSSKYYPVPSNLARNLSGEVNLVDNRSFELSEGVTQERTPEEAAGVNSSRSRSSSKSNFTLEGEVGMPIDAFSTTPVACGPETEGVGLQRTGSQGSSNSSKNQPSLGMIGHESSMQGIPAQLRTSDSNGESEHLRTLGRESSRFDDVTDSKTQLRMPEKQSCYLTDHQMSPLTASNVTTYVPAANNLRILVAEDDPVNSMIIRKRLEKSGHVVHHTVNGEDCACTYGEKKAFFDVVLMDIQMPIVDGLTSTKMIRTFERTHNDSILSTRAAKNGRVPIFAVSASLIEHERRTYMNAGFDGWILKPIDFKRLNTLLLGIVEESARDSCLYNPGQWEKGGWFYGQQQVSVLTTEMARSRKSIDLSTQINQANQNYEGEILSTRSENRRGFFHCGRHGEMTVLNTRTSVSPTIEGEGQERGKEKKEEEQEEKEEEEEAAAAKHRAKDDMPIMELPTIAEISAHEFADDTEGEAVKYTHDKFKEDTRYEQHTV